MSSGITTQNNKYFLKMNMIVIVYYTQTRKSGSLRKAVLMQEEAKHVMTLDDVRAPDDEGIHLLAPSPLATSQVRPE